MLRFVLAAVLVALQPAIPALAASAPAPDYRQDANWVCRPGRADACTADLDATVIAADGTRTVEKFTRATDPKFDCFYVYPTVSRDATPNSDLTAGPDETLVTAFQAARFGAKCRVFAPMYRQVTLAALRGILTGKPPAGLDIAAPLADVRAAWNDYLARDNEGRGVVLIGHSQGSLVLKVLIAEDIDGKPIADRVISAMLIGTNIAVPEGKDVGGDFKAMPLCRAADQTGCIVSYVSFRAGETPPPGSRFGRVARPGMIAACTNPAALAGGRAVMQAVLGARGVGASSAPQAPWTRDGAAVTTPFVKVPGLISAECQSAGGAHFLGVTVNADPVDPRTDTITGDLVSAGAIEKAWGLHLIDINETMGDLIALADAQAKAWAAKRH